MKQARLAWLILLGTILAASPLTAERIRLVLGAASGSDYLPYVAASPDKPSTGLAFDILNAIVERTGDQIVPVYLPVVRANAALSDGAADLELFSNPQWREEFANDSVYTIPYVSSQDCFVFRSDHVFPIKGPSDLSGKSLAMVHGFVYEGLEPLLKTGNIVREDAPTAFAAMRMVDLRRADAGVINRSVFLYLAKLKGLADLTLGPPASAKLGISMRFVKSMSSVVERFNAEILALRKDGTIAAILARYGLGSESVY